jgi:hypothetical protein
MTHTKHRILYIVVAFQIGFQIRYHNNNNNSNMKYTRNPIGGNREKGEQGGGRRLMEK